MRTSFHHQPEAQHPKSSAIHKYAGRLPHLMTPIADSAAHGRSKIEKAGLDLLTGPVRIPAGRFQIMSAAALFAGNEDESDIRGVSVMAVTYQTLIVGDVPRGWSSPPRRAVDAVFWNEIRTKGHAHVSRV